MHALAIAFGLLVAQPQAQSAPAPVTQVSADIRALEALNAAWLNSYVARDADALAAILADDFQAVFGGGRRVNKAQLLARVRSGLGIDSVRWENLNVHVSGDAAIVTGRSVVQVRAQERVSENRNDYADIYVRRDGRWQAVAAHIVPVAPAP